MPTRGKSGSGMRLLNIGVYAVLILYALVTLIPFAYLATSSIKTKDGFFNDTFLPTKEDGGPFAIDTDKMTSEHYQRLLDLGENEPETTAGTTSLNFDRYLLNSVFYASVTSVLATLCCAMAGYGLAKYHFRGRNLVTNLVLTSLVIPMVLLLAPTYQLLYWLGLLDSYAGLILPAMAPAFGVYLFRQAMISSVPFELLESARIDGAGEIRIFFKLVLPLVRPMVGAFLLLTFLGCWNNFIGPQIVLQTPEKMPLAVGINQLRGVYGTNYGLMMAATVASVVPVMALFLLLQREFIAGLTAGAVKG